MGENIRDAMIGTPRMVTRDIVTRVVVERKEHGRLVGILAPVGRTDIRLGGD